MIIEDVVYYEEKNGRIESLAKDTFYYKFLMGRADESINGQNNLKAATDFEAYEKIFTYLLSLGILNSKEYCIDWTPIYGGACFSFNLGKAQKDLDIESMLLERFENENMSDFIHTFCNPVDSMRCDICGSFSFSRFLSFANKEGKRDVFCLACHPLKEELRERVKSVYAKDGEYAAVKARIKIIDDACRVKIAPDKTINILIDEFIKDNSGYCKPSPTVDIIKQILKEENRDEFEVFGYDETGVAILNRKKLSDIDIFSEAVVLNEDGSEIVALFDKAGVIYLDDKAIEFARKLTNNKTLISMLI